MAGALVGGAFLSAALQVLFDRLASPELLNLFRGRKHCDRLLRKLKLTLLGLDAVLDDAEKQQITKQSVKDWLDELKDAVYHADDLLDEIATEALRCKSESEFQSGPNKVRHPIWTCSSSFDSEIVSKLEEIIDRLEYFSKEKDVLGLKEGVGGNWPGRLPSSSLVDESGVCGRDNDKEEVIKLLLSDEAIGDKIDVIPIVGMAGVGKTTLVQLVYNDSRVDKHFDVKAWVCVSEEFDVFRVTRIIIEAITLSTCDKKDLNLLQVKLKESLRGKKFLIVLDDVWNENQSHWDILRTPFIAGAYGSKVIATTRNGNVASIMQTVPIYPLQKLSDEDCWSLCAKSTFNKRDFRAFPNLEKIGKEIVKRCKGLPLAAKTLAGLLRSKLDVEEWENVLKSDIWDLPEDKNNILPALRLSYHYLPSHLKQCFAYCSIFPKDYEFEKEKLVLLWIAQNFVQQPKSNKTLEKVGDEYFNDLLSRSFFHQSCGNNSSFLMHDLVHDLAQVVSGQFTFRLDDKKQHDIPTKAHHFSYVRGKYDGFEKIKALTEVKGLRTFLPLKPMVYYYLKRYLTSNILEDMLQTQGCLRVLSLSHYHITELPNSIGNLIHLRYLDLSETKIKQLPETICSLYNLQTLLLSNCRFLTTLPVEIGKLICLRHLDISGTKLTEMPTQMSRLKGLQHLTAFMIGKYGGSGLNELKEFLHLRGTLSILGLQNVKSGNNALEAKLKEKKQLAELVLEWGSTTDDSHGEREVLGNLEPHTNLKRLTIKNYGGTRFPDWLGDHSFSNLVSLDLDKCDYCFSLPPLGQLPSLKHLNIARMNGITKVGKEFYGDGSLTKPFQSLETLRFEEMLEWVEWYVLGAGEFFQLRELRVIRCPKLVGGLPQHIPSWERLEIRQCSELVASLPRTSAAAGELVLKGCDGVKFERQVVSFLVKLQISDMISLKELTPDLCTLTNLKELEIDRCPSLLSFPNTGLPPMLRSLSILNCEAMHYVLYEGMICLNTCLQRLKISDCSSLVSFAADGLPHTLKELDIFGCPKLVFPLSEGMECHYTSLEHLSLGSCNSIELLPLGFFLKLQSLIISDCANFETLSIQHAHGLQNLTSLKIWWCPNMVSFPQEGFPAPSLTYFEMHDCKKLKSLPEQMNTLLPSLHVLNVGHCPEIESFPEGGLPSKLHLLQINRCEKLLASRREWGIRKLSSLRDFLISRSLLESFPEEGLLPSTLTKLFIHDLPNLVSLNNRGLQLLVSLEELRIWDCPQLKSLPEGGFPASLSMLEIRGCPLLKSRCRRDIGGDWHNIVHITLIMIDNVFV